MLLEESIADLQPFFVTSTYYCPSRPPYANDIFGNLIEL